jgi:hypothetical protein
VGTARSRHGQVRGAPDNLRRTAGDSPLHVGMWFSDSDVHKTLEALAGRLLSAPDDATHKPECERSFRSLNAKEHHACREQHHHSGGHQPRAATSTGHGAGRTWRL